MMLKLLLSCFVVLYLVQHAASTRILAMIGTTSYSHQVFYQQLWREFAIRGHEIVVITSDPTNETLANFQEISIHEVYIPSNKFLNEVFESNILTMLINNRFIEGLLQLSELTLRVPQVQELINNQTEQFDVVIVEHFMTPALALKHRFNCPLIGVMSLDGMDLAHEVMGNAVHAVLYPLSIFNIDQNTSFLMRLLVFVFSGIINIAPYRNLEKMDRIAKDIFGKDTPPLLDILKETDMLFVNANPLFNALRPHTPSTISIAGGMHLKPAKPLSKDLKSFLDNAKEGAIYFSLGSNVKSNELNLEMRRKLLETLGQLPYKVLWKFEDDSLVGKPENVHIIKWAPQQDILRHNNIKLFITQGGLQSLEEALYNYVPVVIIPIFGDQVGNSIKAQAKGIGLVVDKDTFTVNGFKATILEVINNPVYKDSVKRHAVQIQDNPMTPIERAIWWTEYVIRHKGAQHLKGPIIPWFQYYYLDVLGLLIIISSVFLGTLFLIIRLCIRKACSLFKRIRSGKTTDKKKNL